MSYIGIILTTDKRFYIAPPWTVAPGDLVGVTTRCEESVVKTVAEVLTEEVGGEVIKFLEQYTGCELKRVDTVYGKRHLAWPDEKENEDVHE